MTTTPADPPTPPPAAERRRTAIVAAAVGIGLAAAAGRLIASSFAPDGFRSDVSIYADYARQIWAGAVPYRDFTVEYPPGALLVFVTPRLLGLAGEHAYTIGFAAMAIAAAVVTLVLAARMQARTVDDAAARARGRLLTAAAILLLAPVLPFRFDIVPALLTLLAVRAQQRSAPTTAGALLAIATGVKLYPIVLLPLFTFEMLARRDLASLRRFVIGALVAGLAVVGPAFAVAPRWMSVFAQYHLLRGVQIESLPASLVMFAAKLGIGGPAEVQWGFGAHAVVAPGVTTIARALLLVTIAVLACVYALAYRRARRDGSDLRMLPIGCFAAVLAFMLFNKVLSPQYLIWLIPFIGWLRRRAAYTFAGACVLTAAVFPFGYDALVRQEWLAVVGVTARNVLLAVSFGFALNELRGHGAALWKTIE